jgi:hypothetical protein
VKPFLFVVGCERSGTTLLRAMLDSHHDLAVPPESYFLIPLMQEPFSPEWFLSLLADHRRFARWELPLDDVADSLSKEQPGDLAGAVRVLFKTFAASYGKTRWGDKTPGYVRHIRSVAQLLPEAHFVHIIRDGRDVALSWLDVPFGPETITDAASRWRKDVRVGRRAGRRHADDRYLEVRYENLVERPERVLRRICEFAELPFDQGMLDYTARADRVIEATLEPESHRRLREPPTPGLRDWRREMADADVRVFGEVAGDMLVKLGYDI